MEEIENGILDELIKNCRWYEKIIIKLFKRLFIRCYNIERTIIANIFLNQCSLNNDAQ